jgi:molybdopterin converting factor subunit 1
MNTITIRWFAAYRDATGTAQEMLETEAATAADLFVEMSVRHPDLAEFSRALVAINDEMSSWNAPLNAGDEVLFFPPVAGG